MKKLLWVALGISLLLAGSAAAQESILQGTLSGEGGGLTCGNAFYDDGSQESGVSLGPFPADDPNGLVGVFFQLADFGLTPGDFELVEYCTPDDLNFGVVQNNTLFVYNDDGAGTPVEPDLHSAPITIGMAEGTEILPVDPAVPLAGDFWILNRGTAGQVGQTFLLGLDTNSISGNSFFSGTGLAGVTATGLGNYMIRATTQVNAVPVIEVPTLGIWGMAILLIALGATAFFVLRRRTA